MDHELNRINKVEKIHRKSNHFTSHAHSSYKLIRRWENVSINNKQKGEKLNCIEQMMYKVIHNIELNAVNIALTYVKKHLEVNTVVFIILLREIFNFGVNKHLTISKLELFKICANLLFYFFMHCVIF